MKSLGFKLSALIFIFILATQISALALEDKTAALSASDNVTLDFKDADILNVLKIISYKAGVNIVAAPEVSGNITVRLTDVPWQTALEVILRTNGLVFEKQGNIITVAPIAKITEQKKQEVELAQVQPTVTEVFNLKYIDAQDAKKALESQLSPRGKITILEMTGQSGWEFGGKELGKRKKEEKEKLARSKVLIVSDIPPALEEIRKVIVQIDVQPQQVLIETKIIEVSNNKLRDIGFDWGTGTGGATSTAITTQSVSKNVTGGSQENVGGNILGSQVKPSIFSPVATTISGVYPYNAGLSLLFQKLSGFQFEALIHALEEDVGVNTLSAPRILALNNQEATILVGTRYPILKQDTVATTGSPVVNLTLDYYQDIGIQLNVIPQIGADNSINMVVHPAVTSYTNTLGTNVQYPILEIREAETRIFMKDGETIVIGGLLKDVKNKS
ncbi:MAG: secretin and TonB N-terminal domain-containing protein, partial [Candidatus Omnitrophota bacterium]|nr:secretin and TonB N-terminal domain-containing protein [Candidatus Omnitrophota bacterium]